MFSILFETPFLAVCTGNASFDSRIENILSAFHLQDCRIEVGQVFPERPDAVFDTEWSAVREAVQAERSRSKEILTRSLTDR